MKKVIRISAVGVFAIALLIAQACSYSIVHISSLKTFSKDEGTETTSFKTGDFLKAKAQLADNPDQIRVEFLLYAEDVPGMAKGDFVPNTGQGQLVYLNRSADYLNIISPDMKSGTYTLRADLLDDRILFLIFT
ncbi:MAG TPA: hypothetical protein VGO50_15700 [Pyrinomonadaceae bacterium]|jgi:hypothetical protein|nr:hypothetical protein [Pyrinomonadaceae bacterium]